VTAAALVALTFIIVTGAAVRLTGSGLGCPSWPHCEPGSLVPRGATGSHGTIEFLNRLVTGAVSVAVGVAVLGSYRRSPRRDDLVRLSWGLVAGVFANALLGMLVVMLDLSPVSVIGHFLLSLLLLWDGVVLHHRAGAPDVEDGDRPAMVNRPLVPPVVLWVGRALVAAAATVLVLGTVVTGSGPHGGDEEAERLPIALGDAARAHGIAEVVFLALTLTFVLLLVRHQAPATVQRRGRLLLGVLVGQGGLGYLQYFHSDGVDLLGAHIAQEWMIALHVLGAAVVWMATLAAVLSLGQRRPAGASAARPAPATAPAAAAVPVAH
jgi:cytochrome c oxidase assembly protein subunit 15